MSTHEPASAVCETKSVVIDDAVCDKLVSDDFAQLIVDASCVMPDVLSDNQCSSVNAGSVSE